MNKQERLEVEAALALLHRPGRHFIKRARDHLNLALGVLPLSESPPHVCGLMGFDGMRDTCPACQANSEKNIG